MDLEVPDKLTDQRLDHVLDALVADHSRSQLQKLVRRGCVRVDGKRVVRSNVRVRGGARIRLELPNAPRPCEVRIVFEDEHIIVVDKPSGLLTHVTERLSGDSLAGRVAELVGPLPTTLGDERPGIVHRLDRGTSGLMVLGRTESAMLDLQSQFRERTVDKRYVALVHGAPREERWAVDAPLGPAPGPGERQMAHPPRGGKSATTQFELEERLRNASVVSCKPRSGRRHQIRVHLFESGLQIVGETLYRVPSRQRLPEGVSGLRRIALHAAAIGFRHPSSAEELSFEAPLPTDLQQLADALRA